MPKLKHSEMRILDDAFSMHGGYVLDFSDRTMREFFEEELGIEIYQEKYSFNGSSKAKHLRAFVEVEDGHTVGRVMRALWKHRAHTVRHDVNAEQESAIAARFNDLLAKIEGEHGGPRTDALELFKRDQTLEQLIAAIERDIRVNSPAAALDRLHTYCMKKFAHLLEERRIAFDKTDPLHSRVGKYVKALEQERKIRDMTRRIVKSSISVFEQFNDIRNNESFAHDNQIVDPAEARFIFDAVSAFLRFVKTVEASRFGA